MMKRTQNEQSGTATVTLTTGDGTSVITLKNPFNTTDYNVQLTFAEDIAPAGTVHPRLWADTVTKTTFTINVDSDSALGTVDVYWKVARKTQ